MSPDKRSSLFISLTALGVVFGDIGTSPLYAVRECFRPPYGVAPSPENVFGVLSLILWSLSVVVGMKYLSYVLRADNEGEGGEFSLLALLLGKKGVVSEQARRVVFSLGLLGASLIYGDGVLTPAVSVLSAIEGLEVLAAPLESFVIPVTVAVLTGLFALQRGGTSRVGAFFGPLMLLWFFALAALGLRGIMVNPSVLGAVNPLHAALFFVHNGWRGFFLLGAVFLAVTGAEALYADLGHFGRRPISRAWFWCVFPALVLNYFGQGALLLLDPRAIQNPFYRLSPPWALSAMIILSTIAAIIASQALISGAFSLTRQAVLLGYLPRVTIRHTSPQQIGQIYVPLVNWLLFAGTVILIVAFRSSSNLAGAYGLAVSLTMLVSTILMYFVSRGIWHWPRTHAGILTAFFLLIDGAFFSANSAKVLQGGWIPLVIGCGVLVVITTWRRGRELLLLRLQERLERFSVFVETLPGYLQMRLPGTAVYMVREVGNTPIALYYHARYCRTLHNQVLLVQVVTERKPHVDGKSRIKAAEIASDIFGVTVHYGFNDEQDVPAALRLLGEHGIQADESKMIYFYGRETVLATAVPGMAVWRERLFALMARNAQSATAFFKLPPDRVVEIGLQVEI